MTSALPLELVQHCISLVDPIDDRNTLVVLLRVSSGCWQAAARSLYHTVSFKTLDQFYGLIKPLHFLADRAGRVRRCLSYIYKLEFLCDFNDEEREILWNWARPNEPLFPNVRRVVFGHNIMNDAKYAKRCPPPDIYLFDHLEEVCNHFYFYYPNDPEALFPSLSNAPVRSITFHSDDFAVVYRGSVWLNRESYTIYLRQFHSRGRLDLILSLHREDERGTVYLETTPEETDAFTDALGEYLPLAERFNLVIGDTAPPCSTCGWSAVR